MALSTNTELKASIANWLDRSDLTSQIPDFIALFEANANTDPAFKAHFNRVSTPLMTTANVNYISTPSDFLVAETVLLVAGGQRKPLTNAGTVTSLATNYPSTVADQPKAFVVLNGKIEFQTGSDGPYTAELYYYQKIPALATCETNWLLTNYPQIYLFGSLVASEAFLGDDQAVSKWGTLYDNAVQKLQGSTDRNKYSGSALSVKLDAVV